MKQFVLLGVAVFAFASPALALKVTNLDTVAHHVELSGRGVPQVRQIAPDATEYFTGAAQGFLALVDVPAKAPKKSKKQPHSSVVHADGMLSGIIGNERTSQIPADPDNSYVIWPGGDLRLQSRIKAGTRF